MRITDTISIDRPASAVWAVVADVDSHPRWRPALKEFRQVSEGPLRVGSRIREVLSWRGREIVIADEVTALDPDRRLGVRGGWKGADFELEFQLEPTGDGTAVTFDWTLEPKTLLMRLAAPLLRRTFEKSTAEELEGLKRYVEAGTSVRGEPEA
jgi:carbon monoxide dehydrogenase subunit G